MVTATAHKVAEVLLAPPVLEQSGRWSNRVAPGRFEYTGLQFLVIVVVLLGGTFLGLYLARRRRERRDGELTASSGGWRITSALDVNAGDPFDRFPDLALSSPHDVMEGREDGFDVAYFQANLTRRSGPRPHALVQLPIDPPRMRYVTTGAGDAAPPGWGPLVTRLFDGVDGLIVETGPYAVLVRGSGASAEAVGRFALALAKAAVADAGLPPGDDGSSRARPPRPGALLDA